MSEDIKKLFENLKSDYDSGEGDDLGADFFTPCLTYCNKYDRATSDFTSNVIFEWGEAVLKLVDIDNHKCKIRMVAHHKLHDDDKKILEEYVENENKINEHLEKISDGIFEEAIKLAEGNADRETKLKMFAYLIATKRLEIKFAFPHHVRNPNVFHQKYGIFRFQNDDKIGFLGSPNETIGGHAKNIETIEVFNSAIPSDLNRINSWEKKFNRSWNDEAKGFRTKEISKKTLERIISYSPRSANNFRGTNKFEDEKKEKKIINNKWSFQEDAVNIFLEKKSGILEMATGTGKTRTAFKIIDKLLNQDKINKIIIQMKGTELIDQWEKELFSWKLNRDERIRILKQNEASKDQEKFIANFKNNNIDIIFISQYFLANLLQKLKDENLNKTLIIHDEIHNLPTDNMLTKIKGLHKDIEYTLGLSATVKDAYDADKDNKLFEEIGDIIFKFGTEDAIKKGILVEFDVDFIEYELTESERKDKQGWINWRHKQIQLKQKSSEEIEKIFRREVSKINKLAINKISLLENYIKNKLDVLERCFIFAQEIQYGNKILDKLINYIPEIKTHYDEHADKKNLEEFASGNLKCIINCKKLNEGINMKTLSNIILVSSESKRQLIQRLGRVLRIDEENQPNKRAFVIDFIENKQLENMDGADYTRYTYLNELSKIKKLN